MPIQNRMSENDRARAAGGAFFAHAFERNAQYDGVMLGHYLGRVVAKRLFKAGV